MRNGHHSCAHVRGTCVPFEHAYICGLSAPLNAPSCRAQYTHPRDVRSPWCDLSTGYDEAAGIRTHNEGDRFPYRARQSSNLRLCRPYRPSKHAQVGARMPLPLRALSSQSSRLTQDAAFSLQAPPAWANFILCKGSNRVRMGAEKRWQSPSPVALFTGGVYCLLQASQRVCVPGSQVEHQTPPNPYPAGHSPQPAGLPSNRAAGCAEG
jgi:hypothetical protein